MEIGARAMSREVPGQFQHVARRADEADVAIGARIRVRRLELGMSQTDLGNVIGVTYQQVQKYETGRDRIGSGRLVLAAQALNVPPNYFFNENSNTDGTILTAMSPCLIRLLKAFANIRSWPERKHLIAIAEAMARRAKK